MIAEQIKANVQTVQPKHKCHHTSQATKRQSHIKSALNSGIGELCGSPVTQQPQQRGVQCEKRSRVYEVHFYPKYQIQLNI